MIRLLLASFLVALVASTGMLSMAEALIPLKAPASVVATKATSQARSQRLPKGSLLKLVLSETIDAKNAKQGEPFSARLLEDTYGAGGLLLLPKGTLLRGHLNKVQPSRWFGRGASIELDFDQLCLPTGLQHPVALKLVVLQGVVNDYGVVYQDAGYSQKLSDSADKAFDLVGNVTRDGYETGKEMGGPVLGGVLSPFFAIGGAVGGVAYLGGKAVYHAVAPGSNVQLTPQMVLLAQLLADTDIPVAD